MMLVENSIAWRMALGSFPTGVWHKGLEKEKGPPAHTFNFHGGWALGGAVNVFVSEQSPVINFINEAPCNQQHAGQQPKARAKLRVKYFFVMTGGCD